jgi:aminoglycoside phosphotransferase (APT) family kinase protein
VSQEWASDIHLTGADAAALIGQQFPALAPVRLKPLGTGWDNAAFLINDALVFRFPLRQAMAASLLREAEILPRLAPHLPLPIPNLSYVGVPTNAYPFAFAGYRILPGRTADQRPPSPSERADLAPALARFLAALHRIPVDAETRRWAPGDEITRADMVRRAPPLRDRLAANAAALDPAAVATLVAQVDDLATTPPAPATCWVHGDLYARHLLLDEANHLTGVIDWGDTHLGDPALDLSIAYSFLPAPARHTFTAVYGDADPALWRRARFRAIHYGAILTEYGVTVGDHVIKEVGLDALRFALEER